MIGRLRARTPRSGAPGGRARGLAGGGGVLWAGTVAFGGSTVALLAVLSRHQGRAGFSGLATLLSLAFVVSLIPSGVQLRSAALMADGRGVPRFTGLQLATTAACSLAVAPLLALVIRLPVAAVALVCLQMVVALPLATRQGTLLAVHRFTALGTNLLVEGMVRFAMGAALGLLWGITGLAAGIFSGTVTALIIVPSHRSPVAKADRPRTSLIDTSLALALLGIYVQLDVLVAASVVARGQASTYDLAAVPAKGVYLVLLAAGPLVFPFVRRQDRGHSLVEKASLATLAGGVTCTALLIACRPLIARILDQREPGLLLLAVLGVAMTLAAETALLVNSSVARGMLRPWPPLVVGSVMVLACWPFRPSPLTFAWVVLGSQAATAGMSLWVCLRGRRRDPGAGVDTATLDMPLLAEMGQALSTAEAVHRLPDGDLRATRDASPPESSRQPPHGPASTPDPPTVLGRLRRPPRGRHVRPRKGR